MSKDTRIMTVALEGRDRMKAYALYDGDKLAITHCLPISGMPSEWSKDLSEEIDKRVTDGFTVLVEDRTGGFTQGDVSQFSFEDMHDGRSMLFHALDWYYSMAGLGKIIAASEVERYLLPTTNSEGARIERTQDEKGRTIYRVDWSSLRGGHKALLMCVVVAMMPPLTSGYLKAMYDVVGYGEEQEEHLNPAERLRRKIERKALEPWEKVYGN